MSVESGCESSSPETVLMLHGLGANCYCLDWLARQITRSGTRTITWSYRSLRDPVDQVAANLAEELGQLDRTSDGGPIHLVTHSLGCIVARAALAHYLPRHRGRWVMLAPPNRGSHVVRSWLGRILQPWIPAVVQLSDLQESYVNGIGMCTDVEFGVIAARWDWIISVDNTHLDGERDHVVIPTIHSGVLFRRDVAAYVRHFLDHGCFRAPPAFAPRPEPLADAADEPGLAGNCNTRA